MNQQLLDEVRRTALTFEGGSTTTSDGTTINIEDLLKEWLSFKSFSETLLTISGYTGLRNNALAFAGVVANRIGIMPYSDFSYIEYLQHYHNIETIRPYTPRMISTLTALPLTSEGKDTIVFTPFGGRLSIQIDEAVDMGRTLRLSHNSKNLTFNLDFENNTYYIYSLQAVDSIETTAVGNLKSDWKDVAYMGVVNAVEVVEYQCELAIIETALNLVEFTDEGGYRPPSMKVLYGTSMTLSAPNLEPIVLNDFTMNDVTAVSTFDQESVVIGPRTTSLSERIGEELIMHIIAGSSRFQAGMYGFIAEEISSLASSTTTPEGILLDLSNEVIRLDERISRAGSFVPTNVSREVKGFTLTDQILINLPKASTRFLGRSYTGIEPHNSFLTWYAAVKAGGAENWVEVTINRVTAPLTPNYEIVTLGEDPNYYYFAEISAYDTSASIGDTIPEAQNNVTCFHVTLDQSNDKIFYTENFRFGRSGATLALRHIYLLVTHRINSVLMMEKSSYGMPINIDVTLGGSVSVHNQRQVLSAKGIAATLEHPIYGSLNGLAFYPEINETTISLYNQDLHLTMEGMPTPRVRDTIDGNEDTWGTSRRTVELNGVTFSNTYAFRYIPSGTPEVRCECFVTIPPRVLMDRLTYSDQPEMGTYYDKDSKTFEFDVVKAHEDRFGRTKTVPSAILGTMYIDLSFEGTMDSYVAPGEVSNRIFISPALSEAQMWIGQILREIDDINLRLTTVEQKVKELEYQVEAMLKQMNPGVGQMILNMLLEVAVSVLIPAGGVLLVSVASSLIKGASMLARNIASTIRSIATSSQAFLVHLKAKRVSWNVNGGVLSETLKRTLYNALDMPQDFLQKVPRPIYKSKPNLRAENIDYSEAVDFNYRVLTGNTDVTNPANVANNIPNVNVHPDDLPMPEFAFVTEPLGKIRNARVRQVAYDATNNALVRKLTRMNNGTLMTMQPYHARAVITRYHRGMDGLGLYKRKTVLGVTDYGMEGNTLGPADVVANRPQLGGFMVDYEQVGVDRNGQYLWRPLTYQEHGFDRGQLENFYSNLGYTDMTASSDTIWNRVVYSANIQSAREKNLYAVHIPDTPRIQVIESMLRDPPPMMYDFLRNNCQDVSKQIDRYLRTGEAITAMDAKVVERMDDLYVKNMIDEIVRVRDLVRESEARFRAHVTKSSTEMREVTRRNMMNLFSKVQSNVA